MFYIDFMATSSDSNIPQEVVRLRLCKSLQDCGKQEVEHCLKESKASAMAIYDDECCGYTDWAVEFADISKSFIARNPQCKNMVLLPLDNRIISGPGVTQGGVADCAVLTMTEMTFIEFKTNVVSNTEENIDSKTEDGIRQLLHTYDGVIKPRCLANGIEIQKCVDVDFFVMFNKELDVTNTMASRQNYQMEFMNDHGLPLYFENEKDF